jgi:cellulose synthase (UDP-forming)
MRRSAETDSVEDKRAKSDRRRQLGADRRTEPLPSVAPPISLGILALGRLAILITMFALVGFTLTVVGPEVLGE